MANLSVKLPGLDMKNPVIPASGTFGFGYEFTKFYDINVLGSMSLKGTTLEPRYGNPLPRIAEGPSGLLNAIGLQNPGVDEVIKTELVKLREVYSGKAIANIGGSCIDDYVQTAAKLTKEDCIGALELNISCPNVHAGGMAIGTDTAMAAEVTRAVKAVITKPLYVKLSPAIFPVALRMVYQVSQAVNIPVIGMGGISTGRDAIEMMIAGASAVQVGCANLVDPYACPRIIQEMNDELDAMGIENITDIIGKSHQYK